jgi:ABC-type antimicrobial peptide transport system permease subunit
MFQSYFKIAWRNIRRNKGFSLINILGLSIGMASTIFILLWVQDEMSWDRFHSNFRNIHHVLVNRNFNGETNTDNSTPFPLAAGLKQAFPQIKKSFVANYGQEQVLKYNETILKRRGFQVMGDYFDVLKWTFIKGNKETALDNPENIVLTESMANALFGKEDPMGKTIKIDNNELRKVSGIVKDPPANSSVQFEFIISYNPNSDFVKNASDDWVNSFTQTFVELEPGTDLKSLGKQISLFANNKSKNETDFEYLLHPMAKWRLYSDFRDGKNTGGMISYVKLFTAIAIIILLIACVNFMNLSTAKSEKRSKEVGIRKTLGSARSQLILQFYSESFLFAMMSLVVAVLSVYFLLPFFNKLIGKELVLNPADFRFMALSFIMILVTTAVAGSYPALYLSSFNPVKVLKGTFLTGRNAALPRKVLVVFQFGVSVLLISSTVLVYQQIQHVKNRDLGYETDNLLSIPTSEEAKRNAEVIKNELVQTGMVASVTRTMTPLTEIWNFTPAPDWNGKPAVAEMIMTATSTDQGYSETMKTRILAGRDFTPAPVDSNAMLLNKAAVDMMQLKDPIGMEMRHFNRNYTVVGVTENVVMGSPYTPVMPMMTFYSPERTNFLVVRMKEGVKPQELLPKIEKIFKQYSPETPFQYSFVDQDFNSKFITEDLISRLSKIFAGLAIFICCIGLSGLASFTIERRFKEIGIRKVLGASVQQLIFLISKEFLMLVGIAALISIPVTWYLLSNWLANYEYRISISIWLFVGSCLSVLLITLLIVLLNSIRAAMSNPSKSLRTE